MDLDGGFTLFAYRNFYKKWTKNKTNTSDARKIENGLVQMKTMGKSIRHVWVKDPYRPGSRNYFLVCVFFILFYLFIFIFFLSH